MRLHVDAGRILRLEMAPPDADVPAPKRLALHFEFIALRHDALGGARSNVGRPRNEIGIARFGVDVGNGEIVLLDTEDRGRRAQRSEEHKSALQSLMRNSYD